MYIDKLYLVTQRIKYNSHTNKNTYYDYYVLNNTGVNDQNAYLSAFVHSFSNDLF
jgi:hypothetical protein